MYASASNLTLGSFFLFKVLILFGDPAQLSPVEQDGRMVFHKLPDEKKSVLNNFLCKSIFVLTP